MNKETIGLTLKERYCLEISEQRVKEEFLNTKYQMNCFTIKKLGVNSSKGAKIAIADITCSSNNTKVKTAE